MSSVSQDLSKNDKNLCKMSEVDTEATVTKMCSTQGRCFDEMRERGRMSMESLLHSLSRPVTFYRV